MPRCRVMLSWRAVALRLLLLDRMVPKCGTVLLVAVSTAVTLAGQRLRDDRGGSPCDPQEHAPFLAFDLRRSPALQGAAGGSVVACVVVAAVVSLRRGSGSASPHPPLSWLPFPSVPVR